MFANSSVAKRKKKGVPRTQPNKFNSVKADTAQKLIKDLQQQISTASGNLKPSGSYIPTPSLGDIAPEGQILSEDGDMMCFQAELEQLVDDVGYETQQAYLV